jgi:hypothetical protein
LEDFFKERLVHSEPPSRVVSDNYDDIGAPPGLQSLFHSLDDAKAAESKPSPFSANELWTALEAKLDSLEPMVVKNTFFDTPPCRSLSLEDFVQERKSVSCPVSRNVSIEDLSLADIGLPPGLRSILEGIEGEEFDAAAEPMTASLGAMSEVSNASAAMLPLPPPTWEQAMLWGQPLTVPPLPAMFWEQQVPQLPEMTWQQTFPAPVMCPPADARFQVRLADMLEPALPTVLPLAGLEQPPMIGLMPDMPSAGSAGHYAGHCKPCVFLHTKGCGNGAQCTFCHLCPPEERKRRKNEKKLMLRSMYA